jgi:hypothetical protein
MAMRAATRKVLSPISETMIIVNAKTRECNPSPSSEETVEVLSWVVEPGYDPEPAEPC